MSIFLFGILSPMRKSYMHSFCSVSLLTTDDIPFKHGQVLLLYCFYFTFKILPSYLIWAGFSGPHFLGGKFFSSPRCPI